MEFSKLVAIRQMRDHLASHMDIARGWVGDAYVGNVPCLLQYMKNNLYWGDATAGGPGSGYVSPATYNCVATLRELHFPSAQYLICSLNEPQALLDRMNRAIAMLEEHEVSQVEIEAKSPVEELVAA